MNKIIPRIAGLGFQRMTPVCQAWNSDKIKDKGKGDQDVYFSREDKVLMKNLMGKMKGSAQDTAKELDENKQEVTDLLKRYKVQVTDALVQELVHWKNK